MGKTEQISLEAVKLMLRDRGMTFEDLASKLGKERSVVYKTIRNGNPSFGFIVSLMEALNADFDDLREARVRIMPIDGFVEAGGEIYRIRSKDDITHLYNKVVLYAPQGEKTDMDELASRVCDNEME